MGQVHNGMVQVQQRNEQRLWWTGPGMRKKCKPPYFLGFAVIFIGCRLAVLVTLCMYCDNVFMSVIHRPFVVCEQ